MTTNNNRRIAKNTLFLYFRMILVMGANLYISRIILVALGVNDYGIYSVVGGMVTLFSLISGSLSAAIARFLTFELGTKDKEKLKIIFSTSLSIQLCLSVIIIFLCGTVGYWFLNTKMNIIPERISAANIVLLCSTLTFAVNLISVPYNALIIAHEKMSAFAYVSIIEVALKFGVSFLILFITNDRLVIYAILIFMISLIIRFLYGLYCGRHFEECHVRLTFYPKIFKDMSRFAGWNFIGAASGVLRNQGNNIILNLFWGTVVNSAYAISMQVCNAISQLADNFMVSVNPQITKYYAQSKFLEMSKLIFHSSRLSFFLTWMLASVLLLNTSYVVHLWLKEVPEYTIVFIQLILIFMLIESISITIITAMLATGNIKNYQIVVGGLQLLNLPISYIMLYSGFGPISPLVITICISFVCLIARMIMIKRIVPIDILDFFRLVCLKSLLVCIVSLSIPLLVKFLALSVDMSLYKFIWESLIVLMWTGITIFFVGCDKNEKQFIMDRVKAGLKKLQKV